MSTLHDFITAIRDSDNPTTAAQHYSKILCDELKDSSCSLNYKTSVLLKQLFSQFYGQHTVEQISISAALQILSNPKFTMKKGAYLFASVCFATEAKSMLLLVVNLLKKELRKQWFEVSSALNLIHCLCAGDQGVEEVISPLVPDVGLVCTSSRSYLKKRAILCSVGIAKVDKEMFCSVFMPPFKSLLSDEDESVRMTVVTACLEISSAVKDGISIFVPLIPLLYTKVLQEAKSNWLKCKIIRLCARLAKKESRFVLKLRPHLNVTLQGKDLVKSVELEILDALISISSETETDEHLPMILERVRVFLKSEDRNLNIVAIRLLAKCGQSDELMKICEDADLPGSIKDTAARFLCDPKNLTISNYKEITDKAIRHKKIMSRAILKALRERKADLDFSDEWYFETILSSLSEGFWKEQKEITEDLTRFICTRKKSDKLNPVLVKSLVAFTLNEIGRDQETSTSSKNEESFYSVLFGFVSSNIQDEDKSVIEKLVANIVPIINDKVHDEAISCDLMWSFVRLAREVNDLLKSEEIMGKIEHRNKTGLKQLLPICRQAIKNGDIEIPDCSALAVSQPANYSSSEFELI
jgi:Adaptin N terminal region